MKTGVTDRRVRRTRQGLQDALVALMIEKGYEATTVQDIIDRANVGRSTFYAHFADKETLLTSRLEDLRAFLQQEMRRARTSAASAHERGLGFSLAMLEHAQSHRPLYGAIVGRASGALVVKRLHRMIADLVLGELGTGRSKMAQAQRHLTAEFIAGAFMAVLTWWMEHGAALSPGEVDAIFRQLATRGLADDLSSPRDRG